MTRSDRKGKNRGQGQLFGPLLHLGRRRKARERADKETYNNENKNKRLYAFWEMYCLNLKMSNWKKNSCLKT